MENIIVLADVKILNCTQCKFHKIISDPDPNDCCADDVAVICTLVRKPENEIEPNSKWASNRQEFQTSAVSCRPNNVQKEAKLPDWCPALREPLIRMKMVK